MQLLVRVAGLAGAPSPRDPHHTRASGHHHVDVRLDLEPGCTVGELADEIVRTLDAHDADPTITVVCTPAGGGALVLDRDDLVEEVGPLSGSTIELRAGVRALRQLAAAAPASLSGTPDRPLDYGTNVCDGALVEVGEQVEVFATGQCTPTVNGSPVLGSTRLVAGDLVTIGSNQLRLRIDAELRPPSTAGPLIRFARTLRSPPMRESAPVEIPAPPASTRLPGFPVLSATVPLLMGVALWVATRSIATAVFILFSFVFVVASGLEARRESRAEKRFREEEFRADVAESLELVDLRHDEWARRIDTWSPDPAQLLDAARERTDLLWSRSCRLPPQGFDAPECSDVGAAAGALMVRVGTAPSDVVGRVTLPTQGRRDLRDELAQRLATHPRATAPVTIDLGRSAGVAIVGPGELPSGLARSVVSTLATTFAPSELCIATVADPRRRGRWRWCEWLPHVGPRSTAAPIVVLVIDGAGPASVEHARRRLRTDEAERFVVIWLSDTAAGAPRHLGAVAFVDPVAQPRLVEHGSEVAEVCFDSMSADVAEQLARSLAPLRPATEVHLDDPEPDCDDRATELSGAAVSLRSVTTADTSMDSPAAVLARWSTRRRDLAAPIGRVGRGVVTIDLVRDGPHALIAGTTGSGKSELLRTLVMSMALHHCPSELNFLLVDYKGGTAFGPLATMPHSVGLITDLTAELAERALDSLHAEVRRREEALARLGDDYDIASLVIVVDEFATLARELPRFVDGVVDIAQRGRSLGVHLVLATQRPAGVVTDAIRANTDLRIALRVADDEDSRDVVGVSDAARLPRHRAGSAVLRIGTGRVAHFRAAWTGGSATAPATVRCSPLHSTDPHRSEHAAGPAPTRDTELDLAISTVAEAFAASGADLPRRPWLDPLPEQIELASIGTSTQSGTLRIGLVDRPRSQRIDPLDIDLRRDGGIVVLGASGSGRSTTIDTIVAAGAAHAADDIHIDVLATGAVHDHLAELGAVGNVVEMLDTELVMRVLRRAAAQSPASRADGRRRLIVIDGFAEFEQHHERIDRGAALEIVDALARDSRASGVHLAVAAARRSEVPPALFAALGCRLHLRSPTEDDAILNGLPASSADPRTPPGRGHVGRDVMQIAVGPAALMSVATRAPAASLQRLRTRIELRPLLDEPPRSNGDGPTRSNRWKLPIGIDADHSEIAELDLERHHGLIVGPPRSGRTSALTTIATAAAAAGIEVVFASSDGSVAERTDALLSAAVAVTDLVSGCGGRGDTAALLAVDDVVDLLERGGPEVESSLEALLDLADTAPLRIVASGESDAVLRAYSDVVVRLRAGRTGVLLQADPDLHALVLHASFGARGDIATAPGRGWLCSPSDARLVQMALDTNAESTED